MVPHTHCSAIATFQTVAWPILKPVAVVDVTISDEILFFYDGAVAPEHKVLLHIEQEFFGIFKQMFETAVNHASNRSKYKPDS